MSRNLIKIFQIIFGLIFLLSFYGKLKGSANFYYFLNSLHYPSILFHPTYYAIIILELLLSVFILFGVYLKYFVSLAVGLIIIFTFVMIYSFSLDSIVSCGCFGDINIFGKGILSIIRNLVIITIGFVLLKNIDKGYVFIK